MKKIIFMTSFLFAFLAMSQEIAPTPNPTSTADLQPEQEPSTQTFKPSQECQSKLKEYFEDPNNPRVKDYLELQSDITAHRVAWAYMILWQKRGKGLEGVIDDLVKQRDTDPELKRIHAEFKKLKRKGRFNKRYEKIKHSLIAASMLTMRTTLIKKYNVPQDSPFLLQSEDINLATLLKSVANNETDSRVLRQMTNLMDTVDRTYDSREYSDKNAFRTQWKRDQGYQGEYTQEGASGQRGKERTHHRKLSDTISSDLEKMQTHIASMREEIMQTIEACGQSLDEITGVCQGDSIELVNKKFLDFIQSDSSGITTRLNRKYAQENSDDIQKVLSQGGKVLESDYFNAKNFCDNPAKYICESKAAFREQYARKKHAQILEESVNEGTEDYRNNNKICWDDAKYGQSCNSSAGCSDCYFSPDCDSYKDTSKRFGCFNTANQSAIDNLYTPSIKRTIERQTANAKRDIIRMLNTSPQKERLPLTVRQKLTTVINDAQMKIPTTADYKPQCENDTRASGFIYYCSTDSDCQGPNASCHVPQIDYNMYAYFQKPSSSAPSSPHYSGDERPCFVAEGMALTSAGNMYGIIAHELGHLISHDDLVTNISGLGTGPGQFNPFEKEKQCYQSDELSAGSIPANQKVGESIADGIQAQVIGQKIKRLYPQTDPPQFNPKAIDYLRETVADNCEKRSQTRAQLDQMRTSRSGQAHPYGEDRINRIVFANKHIRETLGCNLDEAKMPRSQQKYRTPLKQCMNNP